ncbi:MAG: hypothetical protein ABI833_20190 [Acidobacteriota bacterium]
MTASGRSHRSKPTEKLRIPARHQIRKESRVTDPPRLYVVLFLTIEEIFSSARFAPKLTLASGEVFVNLIMDTAAAQRPQNTVFRAAKPPNSAAQWARVRAAIERAIAPFAGAHEAVIRALEALALEELKREEWKIDH